MSKNVLSYERLQIKITNLKIQLEQREKDIEDLVAALEAVELARLTDTEGDWIIATELTNIALTKVSGV